MEPGEESPVRDAYDELAASYDAEIESNAYNEHIEFPAMTSLIPEVEGKRILDAGCGTGRYTEWLIEQGADVVGVDVSEAMLEEARTKLGSRATFHREDLGDALTFAEDDAFDGVVSSLALGYVESWETALSEFARVLEPGGFLVFSVMHPLDTVQADESSTYFEVEQQTHEWAVDVPYYRRPFSAILNPLLEAGFRVAKIREPQPTAAFEAKQPDRYETESNEPVFLCVTASLP
ncbi:class I SAM-dependent methyltransferase [Halorhabdus salina]|uniref:class I SAM-dependent methyltransferase n=1 Tax=Halorhabdus salina TaxID=2750670 RepID=UPI0015EE5AC4|nr:class I SAM-dependent methyltransferase [Halorhabdus salina]